MELLLGLLMSKISSCNKLLWIALLVGKITALYCDPNGDVWIGTRT